MVTENIPYQTPGNQSSTASPARVERQVHFHRTPGNHKLHTLITNSSVGASMRSASSIQGSELHPRNAVTNGIRANGRAIFDLRISGVDIFDLLTLLEGGATSGSRQSFLEVRKCIFLAEKIRNQVRRQGF